MKKILIFLFIIAIALGGLYTFKRDTFDAVSEQILGEQIDISGINSQSFSSDQLQSVVPTDDIQIETLTERGKEVGEHVSKVLGESIQASEDEVPIHERAFEYGRYIYCQEVVREYEEKSNKE